MKPMLDVHPEAVHGEVFLGNFTDDGYRFVGWTSKRRGRTAYDIANNIVIGARPVFVHHSELQAAGKIGNAVYRRKILGDADAEITEVVECPLEKMANGSMGQNAFFKPLEQCKNCGNSIIPIYAIRNIYPYCRCIKISSPLIIDGEPND